ncbi:zinc-dependent alcohol dehydrogenase family protein [uncultured Halovibrio sp.]|uniref:zinc-dependent alcohol dehydrogenase family protein n=1 Tax=uncultured Halovibrio sp. TaxID=985049 RepID=UPI0025FDC4AF|nr:zinc-dependent alcohol dehydrogenase family protein [uncultured Halovibrio sp.]
MDQHDQLPQTMNAMVLEQPGQPLQHRQLPVPEISQPDQVLLRVEACGVCRTDLHILDGELTEPSLPLIPGHQIVGKVVAAGNDVTDLRAGDRVGVPWLGHTDGTCRYCCRGQENLCEQARFTGYTLDGGYAEYALTYAPYCYPLPPEAEALDIAPLLCAGLIGFRTWRLAGGETIQRLGIYGFGAAAHILCQIACWYGQSVYAFTRPGDEQAQKLARDLGAVWAGASTEDPPDVLDAALVFAPVGELMVSALKHVDRGASVVSGGIHMSDIPSFPYGLLWEERSLKSTANLTREDGRAFLEVAPRVPVRTEVHAYPLSEANQALEDLREGRFAGAAVLTP